MFCCMNVQKDPCTLVFLTDADLSGKRKELAQLLTEEIGVKCVVIDLVDHVLTDDGLQDRPIVLDQKAEDKRDHRHNDLRHRYLILKALLGFVCGLLTALFLGL
jgi:hypothetical protein